MKKIDIKNIAKIDFNNKKDLIKFGIFIAIAILILIIIISLFSSKKMVCTKNNNLIDGFINSENITFRFDSGKIKSIDYDRKIKINSYYRSYGTYIEALESVFNSGYKYMKNKNIETTDDSISINFKTTNSGIVLNNLNIVYNSDTDNTSLRYDILSDIDNDENAYKVKDEYSKKQLKEKIEKLGYTCK